MAIRNCIKNALMILEFPSNFLSLVISLKMINIWRVGKNINA
jgi:hypothetical protein